MSNYLMTLTPMGSYFFGGERTFSVGKEDKNELASYIVESNLFPQQTSLLGMLRFWLLRNSALFDIASNKIKNEATTQEIKDLIGENGFCAVNARDFGKIKKVGFCFLQNELNGKWEIILPTPLDYLLEVDFSKPKEAFYNGKTKKLPDIKIKGEKGDFKPYTAKDGLIRRYISPNGKVVYKESDIFKTDRRIGINRDIVTGTVEDNDFYKQVYYRLVEGFRFAFFAEFNDYALPADGQIVELGGDSSKFVLNYEKVNSDEITFKDDAITNVTTGISKVILLSDTLLDNETVNKTTVFSITEHLPLRFLQFETKADTTFSRTSKDDKSGRFSLFKRGSIFYFDNEEAQKEFKNNAKSVIFDTIGYNKLNN